MLIHEAIQARTPDKPYITRKSWVYLTDKPTSSAIKILPTDTPDGCVISSINGNARRGWQPTADDLIAGDWIPVGL